jgi:outer membrane protein TolC
MRKNKIHPLRSFISPVLIALFSISLAAEITLDQAIREGINLGKNYKNHILEARSLELAKQNARMRKRFSIDSGGSYLFKSAQMEITLPDMNPAPGVVIPGAGMSVGAKHNYDIKLSLSQPIFTGNILTNAVKLESVKLAVEKNRVLLGKIETAAKIKRSYFNYRLLQNRQTSLNVLTKQLQLHQQKLQHYYREELVKKSDLLETEAKIREQDLNLQDLKNAMESERINFKTLCGYDIEALEKNYSEKSSDFAQAFSIFKSVHPVLKTLDEQVGAFAIREKMVHGEYLPQVGGFAEMHYGKPGIDFFQNEWSLYFQGGISVGLKIFDWSKKKRDLQIIDFGIEKIKNEKTDFVKDCEKHLRQLFSAKTTAENKIKTVKELVKIAVEDMKLKEDLLKEQQIANIDYLSALTQKERYVSMQNTIRTQLELINVNINQLTGKFEEER